MSQIVIYRGVMVQPLEHSGKRFLVQTKNPSDAQKADISFKGMVEGQAVFEAWVDEDDLVAVDE